MFRRWPLLLLLLATPAFAAVDLVTLPTRDATQLTIYNSEDISMVREHRLLTVKEGVNRIQFSWANTLIDPTSIEFRILDQQDKVDLVDTTFPAGRNDALQWNIKSQIAGKIPVEIRYFASGITWAADYVGIANEDETKLNVTGYVRVSNNSGEQYDNAQTRLVVGKINLVEKIADLARRPPEVDASIADLVNRVPPSERVKARKALKDLLERREAPEDSAEAPKQVIKQGLSEYFLFTIEGREDIKDKEPKRLVALKAIEVPLESIYKLSDRSGDQGFTKFYRFKNVKLLDDHGKEKKLSSMENLGLSPLPNGTVRLFSEYRNKDLAYVGGTETKYVPIGDRVEVNVGPDKDITLQRRVKDQKIANVVARQYKRRLDNQFVLYYDLVDYDETFFYEEELVSGKPAKIEVERQFDANVVLWGEGEEPKGWTSNEAGAYVDLHKVGGSVERVDQQHVKYFMDLKPGKKQTVEYSVTYKRRKVGPELNAEKKREPLPAAQNQIHLSLDQARKLLAAKVHLGGNFVIREKKKTEWPPDDLAGEISSIKGNFIEVSVGSDDGLFPGHRLRVMRDGREIATLQVEKTDYSSARTRIVEGSQAVPRAGDFIETVSKPPAPKEPHSPPKTD